jgi:hypothetical protein
MISSENVLSRHLKPLLLWATLLVDRVERLMTSPALGADLGVDLGARNG